MFFSKIFNAGTSYYSSYIAGAGHSQLSLEGPGCPTLCAGHFCPLLHLLRQKSKVNEKKYEMCHFRDALAEQQLK